MKYIIYDILVHIAAFLLVPFFLFKMLTTRKYREGIPERFGLVSGAKLKKISGKRVVWIHAVSVGETRAIMPVLRLFKKRHPDIKVAFSTVTRTGQATAAAEGAGLIDALIYFPLDLSWAVERVVKQINPVAFVAVEKEIWPNCFRALRQRGASIIVANGTMSERSFGRYKKLGFIFRDVFGAVSFFCARTGADLERARGVGVDKKNAAVIGNLKFDITPPSFAAKRLATLKKALGVNNGPLIVAGSTHAGEEEAVLNAYMDLKKEFKGLRLVLAPRHPERFAEAESIIRKTGLKYSRRSKGSGEASDVVLLDTVGELMMAFSFSTVAVVGGSIAPGIGGHNLLEPAYYGKPVVYGERLTTYIEMAEMLEAAEGGIRAEEGALGEAIKKLLSDEVFGKRTGRNARAVVEQNRGAAEKTVEVIERFSGK